MTDHFLNPSLCPECGDKLDAATNMPGETNAPEPNDITGCLNCGAVLQWDADMRLQEMSAEEFNALPVELKKQMGAFLYIRSRFAGHDGRVHRERTKQ